MRTDHWKWDNKRVFRGWINLEKDELPESQGETMQLRFGKTKHWDTDVKCKITVEWMDE